MDDKCFEAFERIRTLEQWKDGNGGKGVEERLRHLENTVELAVTFIIIGIGRWK